MIGAMQHEKLVSWLTCKKCALNQTRRHVVLGRGQLPADLLFIGEAPGKSEDLRGEAFIGPSGRVLRLAMKDATAMSGLKKPPSFYITNVIACRPCDEKRGPNRQPTDKEAWQCWPRLELTEYLVKPKQIIFLGRVAEHFCLESFQTGVSLQHPAFILRRGGTESAEYRILVRGLSDIFKEVARA